MRLGWPPPPGAAPADLPAGGAGLGFPARFSAPRHASKAARSRQRDQVEWVTPSGSAASRRRRRKPLNPSNSVRVESRDAKRDSKAASIPGCKQGDGEERG